VSSSKIHESKRKGGFRKRKERIENRQKAIDTSKSKSLEVSRSKIHESKRKGGFRKRKEKREKRKEKREKRKEKRKKIERPGK
jgi:predicted Rdx family selenoprotein